MIYPGFAIVAVVLTFPIWSTFQTEALATAFLVISGVMASVLLHEFAHLIASRRMKQTPLYIKLHASGGEAVFIEGQLSPADHQVIALAGPLANIVIGVGILAFYFLLVPDPAANFVPTDGQPWSTPPPQRDPVAFRALQWIGWSNIVFAVVNLLPAFPLDGGWYAFYEIEKRYGYASALAFVGWAGICFSIVSVLVFCAGALAGFVLLLPPDFAPNWKAVKEARKVRRGI